MSLDSYKSKRIRVFRNGDIFSPAKKMVISFLHALSMVIHLNSGAVRKLFTLGGRAIQGLDSLEDGGVYIASSGETFKKVPYPLEAGEVRIPTREERLRNDTIQKSAQSRRPTTSHLGPQAMRLAIFRNGGFNEPVGRLLINHKNCKDFSQLLMLMSELIKFQSGQVRKVHDAATGLRITSFKDMYDGQNLVGIGYEPCRFGHYNLVKILTNSQEKKPDEAPRKVITLYPNGDSFHNGWTVSVKASRFPTLKKLLEHLNKQITLVTGLINQVYTLDGLRIMNIQDLQSSGSYVLASGSDPFVFTNYNVNDIEVESPFTKGKGLDGSTTKNEMMSKIRRPYQPLYDPDAKLRPKSRKTASGRPVSRAVSRGQSTTRFNFSRQNSQKTQASFETGQSSHRQPSISNRGANSKPASKANSRIGSRIGSKANIEEEDMVRATKDVSDEQEIYESPILQVFNAPAVDPIEKKRNVALTLQEPTKKENKSVKELNQKSQKQVSNVPANTKKQATSVANTSNNSNNSKVGETVTSKEELPTTFAVAERNVKSADSTGPNSPKPLSPKESRVSTPIKPGSETQVANQINDPKSNKTSQNAITAKQEGPMNHSQFNSNTINTKMVSDPQISALQQETKQEVVEQSMVTDKRLTADGVQIAQTVSGKEKSISAAAAASRPSSSRFFGFKKSTDKNIQSSPASRAISRAGSKNAFGENDDTASKTPIKSGILSRSGSATKLSKSKVKIADGEQDGNNNSNNNNEGSDNSMDNNNTKTGEVNNNVKSGNGSRAVSRPASAKLISSQINMQESGNDSTPKLEDFPVVTSNADIAKSNKASISKITSRNASKKNSASQLENLPALPESGVGSNNNVY